MAQPVYLVDSSVYRAPDEYKMSMSKGLANVRKWCNVSGVLQEALHSIHGTGFKALALAVWWGSQPCEYLLTSSVSLAPTTLSTFHAVDSRVGGLRHGPP